MSKNKNNSTSESQNNLLKSRFSLIKKSDFMLIPNIMTLSRVIAIPLVAGFAYLEWNWCAAISFSLAGISDYADGWIARKYHYESKLGALLDPLADKLIIVSTMIMLLWLGRLNFGLQDPWVDLVPPTLVIVTVGREIAITGLRGIASSIGVLMPADRGGKIKTWIQFWAIILLILHKQPWQWIGQVLLTISVITALISGIRYTVRFIGRLPN